MTPEEELGEKHLLWKVHLDIKPYFSGLPIMCPITEVEGRKNRFLIFPSVYSIKGIKRLPFSICKMKKGGIIREFSYAAILEDFFH